MKNSLTKSHKKIILKFIVSLGLFALIFSKVNVFDVIQNLKLLNPVFIPIILFFLILNYLISSIRWKKLLVFENTDEISVRYLSRLYFIGAFFNNFMPTSIGGDVYKVYKLGKKIQNAAHAFSATFMERFTGVIALVLISYVGFIKTWDLWLSFLPDFVSNNSTLLILLKLGLLFGFWIGVLAAYFSLKLLSKKFSKLERVHTSLSHYINLKKVLVWAFVTSFAVQLLAIFTQYFIFLALGIDLPFFYSLFIFPVITLASFLIPSLNGIGVQDYLYVELFKVAGIDPTVALTASITYHLFRVIVSLIGGVFYALEKDN